MAGEYEQLVKRAQADADPAHRQLAMTEIQAIAPSVSHDTMGGADAAAAAVLARLYQETATAPPPALAPAERDALDLIARLSASHGGICQAAAGTLTRLYEQE